MKRLVIHVNEEIPADDPRHELVGPEDLVVCGPWRAEAELDGRRLEGIAYIFAYCHPPAEPELNLVFAYKNEDGENIYLLGSDFNYINLKFE